MLNIAFSFYLANKINLPLVELTKTTTEIIQANDLTSKIHPKTNLKEIKQLADNFNQLQNELYQKEAELENKDRAYKLAGRKIVIEEALNKQIIKTMGDGLITIDKDRCITSFNKAAEEITGWKSYEVYGKPCALVLKSKNRNCKSICDKACFLKAYKHNFHRKKNDFEAIITTKEGHDKYIGLTPSILRDDSNNIKGGVIVFRDITKVKEIEQVKMNFVSTVSHEIRTPLTSIKGYVATLLRPDIKFDYKEQKEIFNIINMEADRLTRLISNLLNVSKIEAGKFEINKEVIAIPVIINEIVTIFKVSTKKHEFKIDLETDFPNVLGDMDQIEQVLYNLISNAVKYSPEGGVIEIKGTFDHDFVYISIKDNGIGIGRKHLDKIFDKFYRVDDSYARNTLSYGSGLGLYITQNIIKAHNGRIWVESVEGEGSTFTFSLPRLPQNEGNRD